MTRIIICRMQMSVGEYAIPVVRGASALANAFGAVSQFYDRESDYLMFRQQTKAAFAPRHATLYLSIDFEGVQSVIQQTREPTTKGLTHLHAVFFIYSPVWSDGRGIPRPGPSMLTHLILEPSGDWNERLLVTDILPFFLSFPAIQRVLVRLPRSTFGADSTLKALEEFARARNERRIWVLDAPSNSDFMCSVYDDLDADKWTAGRMVLASR